MRRMIISFLAIGSLAACNKISHPEVEGIKIIGHGGMGFASQYPMNSLESVINCLSLNADGVEMDIQLTKDGHLIAYHDYYLRETTSYQGDFVNDNMLADLQDVFYTHYPYAAYKLRALDDILMQIASRTDKLIYLDCKLFSQTIDQAFRDSFARAVADIAEKYNLHNRLMIETTDAGMLEALHRADSKLRLSFYFTDFEELLQLSDEYVIKGIVSRRENVSKEQIQWAHDRGLEVSSWSVRSAADLKDALNKNIDAVQADNLRAVLKSAGR